MVTANLNHERRPSSVVDSEDDEINNRQIQNRLVSFFYISLSFYFDIETRIKMSQKENYSSSLLIFQISSFFFA